MERRVGWRRGALDHPSCFIPAPASAAEPPTTGIVTEEPLRSSVSSVPAGASLVVRWNQYSCPEGFGDATYDVTLTGANFADVGGPQRQFLQNETSAVITAGEAGQTITANYTVSCSGMPDSTQVAPASRSVTIEADEPESSPTPTPTPDGGTDGGSSDTSSNGQGQGQSGTGQGGSTTG